MSNQFDFALDADDPATISQSAFLMSPPFSQNLTVRSLQTQKSFLITDIRLRSISRQNDTSIYGLDKWAIDVYHKLASYESQPGVSTRLVDVMGHDIYDRYDNRAITPDTPTQKTVYALSAREVDLLIRSGAYDDPAATEEQLRQQLVGQTWSMPDQVMVSESTIRLPRLTNTIGNSNVVQYPNQEFTLASVQDNGKKTVINSHTPGSNMASVMDLALRKMAPDVTPMPDVNHDLDKANDVELSSTKHQIKSQILDNELDLGVNKEKVLADQAMDFDNDNVEDENQNSESPVLNRDDEQQYQDAITNDVAKKVGLAQGEDEAISAADRKTLQKDQQVADEFMEDNAEQSDSSVENKAAKRSSIVNKQNHQQVRRQTIRRAEVVADNTQNSQPVTNNSVNNSKNVSQTNWPASKPSQSMADLQQQVDQSSLSSQSNNRMQVSEPANNDMNFDNIKAPSQADLKKMLDNLRDSGVAKDYEEPDYNAAAQNSPAAQREKLKLRRRLAAQEQADKDKVNQAVQQNKAQPNVPNFFSQADEREL